MTAHEKRVAAAKELAQQKAAGKKLEGRLDPALAMAYAYEEAFCDYIHHPSLKYIKDGYFAKNAASNFFEQAAKLADSVGADYGEFVKAQFYWIHKWFGRACKPYELRGRKGKFPAIKRWREYKKLGRTEAVSSSVTHVAAAISKEELNRINKDRLEQLMGIWGMDEDRCLITFVPEGIFDEQWLATNNRYQKLKREGRL